MSDHIAAVAAQAQREAERLWPSYQTVGFSGAADRQAAYVEGQVAIASRLTLEKIAEALDLQGAQVGDCGHEPGDALTCGNGCWKLLLGYADAILALLTEEDHGSNT